MHHHYGQPFRKSKSHADCKFRTRSLGCHHQGQGNWLLLFVVPKGLLSLCRSQWWRPYSSGGWPQLDHPISKYWLEFAPAERPITVRRTRGRHSSALTHGAFGDTPGKKPISNRIWKRTFQTSPLLSDGWRNCRSPVSRPPVDQTAERRTSQRFRTRLTEPSAQPSRITAKP